MVPLTVAIIYFIAMSFFPPQICASLGGYESLITSQAALMYASATSRVMALFATIHAPIAILSSASRAYIKLIAVFQL
jgi:hypothetical protein